MKITSLILLCICFRYSSAQKLNITSLDAILQSTYAAADSLLKKSNFKLADKESGQGYDNYYYTSQETLGKGQQLLRTVSFMDVYSERDTSRLILYRTYHKPDQDELSKQLLVSGYELSKRSANSFIYKRGDHIITNNISEKNVPGGKPVTAYEFELGR